MAARDHIGGRLFGLAVSVLMLAEAYALWRPQALGGLPQPDLGPFSHYRLVIAILTAGAGVVVALASIFRDHSDHDAPQSHREEPRTLDFGPAPPAAPAPPSPEPSLIPPPPRPAMAPPSPPPAAPVPEEDTDDLDPFPGLESMRAPTAAAPEPGWRPNAPEPPAQPAAVPPPAEPSARLPPQPPGPEPLAGAALAAAITPLFEPLPPVPAPPPPSAPPEAPRAPRGDRGRFLDLSDEAHQFRIAGHLDEALERYSEALTLARRRAAEHPGDLVARRDLAAALTHVGEIHDREGRLDAAIGLHEESLGVRRHLAAAAPSDPTALIGLSTGLERLADAREARGHRSRARDLFRLRLQLAQRLAARAPDDHDLQAAVAYTRERLRDLDAALAV